uniref:Transposase n=1 Tax=Ascaris lumbricoides TaxID=6252 RepID=A0A0M3HJ29_ASCLU
MTLRANHKWEGVSLCYADSGKRIVRYDRKYRSFKLIYIIRFLRQPLNISHQLLRLSST